LGVPREPFRLREPLPLLRAVLLHHPRAEGIRYAYQRRLGATERLGVQRTRVVRLLAYGVVEQDRAHLSVYCTSCVANRRRGCPWRMTAAYRRASSRSTRPTVSRHACARSISATRSWSSIRTRPTAPASSPPPSGPASSSATGPATARRSSSPWTAPVMTGCCVSTPTSA